MALSEQVINVPLTVLDEHTPKTSGLQGALTKLVNAQVTKYQGAPGAPPNAVRVDKRDAFVTLSDVVRDSATGAVIGGATLANQTLLTPFDKQLLLVANDKTHVYSKTLAAWMRHDYQLTAFALEQDFVHTSNSVAGTPDFASMQGVSCSTWYTVAWFDAGGGSPQELPGAYFRVVDSDGVVLRADTLISSDTRIKVVSDGAYFWIFTEKGDATGSFTVTLVDRNGVTLTSTTVACAYAVGDFWDITAASFGPLLAQPTGAGVQFTKFSTDGITITKTTVADNTIAGFHKLGFLTNGVDANAYLGTVEHVGANNNTIRAYRVPAALAQNHLYAVAAALVDEVANITGYVVNGAGDIVVAYGLINPTGTNYLNNTVFSFLVTFAGVSTALQIDHSMSLASRAFKLGQSYYAVGYYPSNVAQVSLTEVLPNQPTYFLIPLSSSTQRTAGRWEYASAYADWQAPASKSNFALASVVQAFVGDGNVMKTALSYRAESVTTTSTVQGRRGASHFNPYNVTGVVTTVGVKSYAFGAPGTAVEFNGEILLPGPGASVWSGQEFSEHGIALAFEQPTLTLQASGGGFAALTPGAYQIVVVGEWTDTNGRRVRSRPSPPANVTVGASQFIQVSGFMNHATNKKDLLVSIYSTAMVPDSGGGNVQTTLHYKVTFDVLVGTSSPLYNDSLATTWSYNHTFSAITANEILYTDKGQLENYPAPPFSRGCIWKDRACLVGPDNAIWFPAEPTEGDATWYHPAFRMTLPTNDKIKSISATTEGYLLVQCEESQWYFPSVTFPDSSGANGSIPSAVELKFNMGGTGPALATNLGCVYGSSKGGAWLVTRDLQNVWLGQAMADTLAGPIASLAIDSRQRIYAVSGSTLAVYDTVSSCWYEWSVPGFSAPLLAVYQGQLVFGDGSALVWMQDPGSFVDSQFLAGVSTQLPYFQQAKLNSLHFGGVRNFASLLEMQLIGDTHTASTVTLELAFDDNPGTVESETWATDPAAPFEYSYGPANQLCSAVEITITESLGAGQVAGQGYSLELIALTVGLYSGQKRLPDASRV